MRSARVAMVGAGWWAHTAHLPALAAHPSVSLVAVVDRDRARAEQGAASFGVERTETDLTALLQESAVDAVVVATPHTTHAALAEQTLSSGVSALVEKPMTTDADDAWRLVDLARKNGLVLSVGVPYLHAPTAHRVVAAVRTQIGELVSVAGEFSSGAGSLFAVTDDGDSAHDPTVPHGTTYSDPSLSGGGQGHTQLSHLVTTMVATTGLQAVEVSAFMSYRKLRVDLVDALAFRLENGALGTLGSTGTTPPGVPARQLLRYHGTAGMVEHDILRGTAVVHREGGDSTIIEPDPTRAVYQLQAPVDAFVRVLVEGCADPAPGAVGAASASLLDAAYRAATSGNREQVHQGALHMMPEELADAR
ncbi:Gfo/Idh/MocA family protein [Pseudactinotalea terrae]|uniref:Gfo/Idh/MocA family protein n=1 Tax=Pseudactinotalea terrae TaxID=1743262 RepID=UPI0012E2DD57|nr:Gfo/Idh/MocA family oxidoreductase [Pseudactinotalea terrae]